MRLGVTLLPVEYKQQGVKLVNIIAFSSLVYNGLLDNTGTVGLTCLLHTCVCVCVGLLWTIRWDKLACNNIIC